MTLRATARGGLTEMRQATRKRMNIHLLHLEAVELFLDLLGEQRGEAIARRRLGAAVVDVGRPRRVNRQAAGKHDAPFRSRRRGRS